MNHKQRRQCTLKSYVRAIRHQSRGTHTHQTLVCQCRAPLQVEQHRHVILVVGRIETRHVDQRVAQAVPKVLCVQGRFPIIRQVDDFPRIVGGLYNFSIGGIREIY